MALLVPANGATFFHGATGAFNVFGVMGPIPAGRWIDLVFLDLWAEGTAAVEVGLSVGPSPDASVEGFGSGVPLITSSNIVVFGSPGLSFLLTTSAGRSIVIAAGRRVTAGPSFIHVAFVKSNAVNASLAVSARILGLALEKRSRLGVEEDVVLP